MKAILKLFLKKIKSWFHIWRVSRVYSRNTTFDSIKHVIKSKPYNSVSLKNAKDSDLEKLGRKVLYVEKDKRNSNGSNGVDMKKIRHSTMNMVRNKKTGRIIVYPGSVDDLKRVFNENDFEIVESEIKDN